MIIKLSRDDFVRIYDLRCVGFLRNKGFKPIEIARDRNHEKVFSLFFKNDGLLKAIEEFNVVEAERLARIREYEQREKEYRDRIK